MRLIDADALLEAVKELQNQRNGINANSGAIIKLIAHAPTVEQDSEPVAWLINWDNKEWIVTKENEDVETAKAYNWEMKPLYTSPPKQDSGEAVAILHRKTLEVYSPKLTVHHKADITFIKQNESDIDSDMKYMLLADGDYKLYTSPPKREWRGLNDEDIEKLNDVFGYFKYGDAQGAKSVEFYKAIESKLKELNHD